MAELGKEEEPLLSIHFHLELVRMVRTE